EKGIHHSDTGIFNKDGTLDTEKFEALKEKYPDFITADDIAKMRKDEKDGAHASKGEFLLTLNLFSDCALVNQFGDVITAISLSRLENLYKKGPELFEEVARS